MVAGFAAGRAVGDVAWLPGRFPRRIAPSSGPAARPPLRPDGPRGPPRTDHPKSKLLSVDLAVVLTCGKSLHLARGSDEPVTFEIERTWQIDIVCRRSRARIRFGSDTDRSGRRGWHGVAPEMADSNLADEGSPGDR